MTRAPASTKNPNRRTLGCRIVQEVRRKEEKEKEKGRRSES